MDLDEYNSFQFDAGIAYRYNLVDQDRHNEQFTAIINAINALLRAWGAKGVKPVPYKPVVERPKPKNKGDIISGGVTNMTVTEVVEK